MRYKIPIYNSVLYVVVGSTMDEAIDKLPASLRGHRQELKDPGICAGTIPGDGVFAVCFVNTTKIDEATVFHEAGHVAWFILNFHGVAVDLEHQEAFAYLLGWVGPKLLQVLKRKR